MAACTPRCSTTHRLTSLSIPRLQPSLSSLTHTQVLPAATDSPDGQAAAPVLCALRLADDVFRTPSFELHKQRFVYRLGDALESSLGDAKRARWVTLRARWVTLRARWVTLRACWVTLRARWVTLRARWVTLRARWVTLRARWVTLRELAG
jgi:hypothetical protein